MEEEDKMEQLQEQETLQQNETVVCPNCKTINSTDHAFCMNCGASISAKTEKRTCAKCGSELSEEQLYCPKCGEKYGESKLTKEKKKKPLAIILPIAIATVLLITGIVIFFIVRGTPVESVTLNKTEIILDEGKNITLVCTVNPSNAKNQSLIWKSTNSTIATVSNEGVVSAKAQGVCTIIVTSNNGKTDECKITVEQHIPDFKELFSAKNSLSYVSIASDGEWMKIDTNPTDIDDDDFTWSDISLSMEASALVEEVNKKLQFSSSLYQKMCETTWSQGRLYDENNYYKVSWTYHPDKGLEILYEMKKK